MVECVGIDDRAAPLVDPALKAWNGTSLAELFPSSVRDVEAITVRQLLGMRVSVKCNVHQCALFCRFG